MRTYKTTLFTLLSMAFLFVTILWAGRQPAINVADIKQIPAVVKDDCEDETVGFCDTTFILPESYLTENNLNLLISSYLHRKKAAKTVLITVYTDQRPPPISLDGVGCVIPVITRWDVFKSEHFPPYAASFLKDKDKAVSWYEYRPYRLFPFIKRNVKLPMQ